MNFNESILAISTSVGNEQQQQQIAGNSVQYDWINVEFFLLEFIHTVD